MTSDLTRPVNNAVGTSPAAFQLFRGTQQVMGGKHRVGGHRSGWPFVISALSQHQSETGILIDDYTESTFGRYRSRRAAALARLRRSSWLDRLVCPDNKPPIWRQPWVGIFHHPPYLPPWINPAAPLQKVLTNDRFRLSRPHLKGAITLSRYSADWLQEKLAVPVRALKHPTEFPTARFSWEAFEKNPQKKVVQVGWYLRNYRAIYQVRVSREFQKVHLAEDKPWIIEARRRIDKYSPYRDRPDIGTVTVTSWLEHAEYDHLLCENVILLEVFDASANNAVIEAIVRNTPIVVNRHPAVVEYLGETYPLFYDNIDDVERLLDASTIKRAHLYLTQMDKSDLRIERFVEDVENFITQVSQKNASQ